MMKEETKEKKHPWNHGKRKPYEDEYGFRWCQCLYPKLTDSKGGQAICLLCMTPWFH